MWECKICRRLLEEEDETCWSCSSLREQVEITQIATEELGEEQPGDDERHFTWECSICRRLLEEEDETCWSCGSPRPGVDGS